MPCLASQRQSSITVSVAIKYSVPFWMLASKMFDNVLLNGLLAKLIKRNVPLPLVRVLYNWFSGFSCSVAWNSLIGNPFCVYCAVRQGGVLSPLLFAIHVHDLTSELRQSVMACILARYSLVLFYMLMILHYWLVAAVTFGS